MFGRMIKIAALAGVGTMAYRWWQNKQAEDREYSSGDMRNTGRSSTTGAAGGMGSSTGGMGSSSGGFGSAGGGTASPGGTTSPIGSRADQVPAQ